MTEKNFLNLLGQVDDSLIQSDENMGKKKKPRYWVKWASMAAAAFLLTVGIFAGGMTRIPLGDNSSDVTVRYALGNIRPAMEENSLIYLTEEELFTHWYTAVFEGTVEKINNIVMNFNGHAMNRALAEIKVERVYRGDVAVGDTAVILLPCSVGKGVWVEDTDTVAGMREGDRGIFMPIVYEGDSFIESNGATLYLKELAPYGLADGVRYVFLDRETAPVYHKSAYPSLSGISSFDEIRNFVAEMVEKTSGLDG